MNRGGYRGERIDSDAVLEETRRLARSRGFEEEVLTAGAGELVFLKRPGSGPKLYLSTGMHGDEPAGPVALREQLRRDAWPAGAALWICPRLNPTGCRLGTRENADGVDQNRDYLHLRSAETRAHVAWMERQPDFDLHVCLHEDWEAHGFYLYEINPDGRPSRADAVVGAVASICPVDDSAEIDGRRSAAPGIIRPPLDPALRPEWPEAFWLLRHRSRFGYTLEAPSDWPLQVRVAAFVAAVDALCGEGWVEEHLRPAANR
jgi:hypothetical protein